MRLTKKKRESNLTNSLDEGREIKSYLISFKSGFSNIVPGFPVIGTNKFYGLPIVYNLKCTGIIMSIFIYQLYHLPAFLTMKMLVASLLIRATTF